MSSAAVEEDDLVALGRLEHLRLDGVGHVLRVAVVVANGRPHLLGRGVDEAGGLHLAHLAAFLVARVDLHAVGLGGLLPLHVLVGTQHQQRNRARGSS